MARHNIFIFNIKPRILGDYASVKSRLSAKLAQPLFILPFFRPPESELDDPKRCFESLAKIESLKPMAVVDEDRSFLDDVEVTYETYAYMINAHDLMSKKSDLSFLIKNFEQAASLLENQNEIAYRRMHGVMEAYRALDAFLNGDLGTAKQLTSDAIKELEDVLREAEKSASTAAMVPSTKTDIAILRALENMIEMGFRLFESGRQPAELLPYLENYFSVAEEVRVKKGRNYGIYEELSRHLLSIVEAKNATNYVEILPGSGNILVPFWVISITYTFATGALMWKKGKEVEEKLLVAATAPLATQPVTDIFGASAGFLDRLTGKEEKLTTGFIGKVLEQVKKASIPSSARVIPPLSTREEGEQIAEDYLSSVNRKVGGKIRFGTANSLGLIYAAAEIRGDDIYVQSLENSQVKLAPYLEQLMKIAL